MEIITSDFNVHMGVGRTSRMTWEEFKTWMETYRGVKYDPDTLSFYRMTRGEKRNMTVFEVHMLAAMCGCYEDLSDYITRDYIIRSTTE